MRLNDQERDAMRRLAIFTETPGDYITPLLAAYNEDGEQTYGSAVTRLHADLRVVLGALRRTEGSEQP